MKKVFFTLLIFSSFQATSQNLLEQKLDGREQGKKLVVYLEDLKKTQAVQIYYLPEWIESVSFQQSYAGQTLGDALQDLFLGTELSFILMYPTTLVIVKDPTQSIRRQTAIVNARKEQKKIERYVFGQIGNTKKGQRITLTGKVIDEKTDDPLAGATIQTEGAIGTTTDEQGRYSLVITPGQHVLNFSFVNYEDKLVDLEAYQDGVINLEMEEVPIFLEEVVIQDKAAREITTSRIGQTQLTLRDMKRAPALMGEVDLIRQVQILPGVTTAGEAASGFNVRGGTVDQNLVLYDGLPVFNTAHAFGFFSAFNSQAIRDVSFFRGGIPAEYGGRVSSVLDIRTKDGDLQQWNGNAGIGALSSNFLISGPIRKEKTAIIASVRSTYSNWPINTIRTNYVDLRKSSVFFADGTLKLTHLFSQQTKLSVTGYGSRDQFRLFGDSTYQWNNSLVSARVDHQFSSDFDANFVLGISSYNYKVINAEPQTRSELSYRLTNTAFKSGFNYQAGRHKINFGLHLNLYQFNPGRLAPTASESTTKPISLQSQNSMENALYVGDAFTINEKFFVEAGLRLPAFTAMGPADVPLYTSSAIPSDSLHFKKGEAIKNYFGLEPRLSVRFTIDEASSIKAGYNRVYQFLHLITNTTAITPVDIWQPSNYYFKPQKADQVSIGYFRNFKEKKYEAFVEGFYKTIENLLDFKDGADLILNNHLETDLLQGKGEAYGIETSFSKLTGRWTGSINYTYARSLRRFAGLSEGQSINNGNWYPSNFDQPHVVNFTWRYGITRRYFFTGNFTYHTGRPITAPEASFIFEGASVATFSERNQYRIPDYHRLDIAFVAEGNHKRKKLGDGTWVFALTNVYARKNPYTVFFKSSGAGLVKPYQLSVIGTILPSISYNFKF